MAKYRVNGKFANLKTFIKTYGADAVIYDQLDAKEKRIWNGVNTYQKRAVLNTGQFAPKTLTENPTIKAFARSRGESLKAYIEENQTDINKFMNQGLINRSVNSRSIHSFIENHKGTIIYKGKEIDKNQFLYNMDLKRSKDSSTKNVVESVYEFEVKDNGKTLVLKKVTLIKSPKKKKGQL